MDMNRRHFIIAAAAAMVAPPAALARTVAGPRWVIGHIPDRPHNIDLIDMKLVPREFHRQVVPFRGPEPVGSLVIELRSRHLFYIMSGGQALRFGVAVGRDERGWRGTAIVARKAAWPSWTPTANMRRRNPSLPVRMAGGPDNPLGARALYLYQNGRDTLLRIHGTNDPSSIGKAASSGCFRMFNEHVFELFGSVPVGTRVLVR